MAPITMRQRAIALGVFVGFALGSAGAARADDADDAPRVDSGIDGAIIVGAIAAAIAPMAVPTREHRLWNTQLLGAADDAALGQFSHRAAQLSDLGLGLAIAAPAAYLTGSTVDDRDGDRLVIYGETLAIDLALAQSVKYLAHRPRPYLYNASPEARRHAIAEADDGWRSFYSSHAAIAFGAAVAGAYLLNETTASPTARAVAWGSGFAVAAATANLRVRAGRHFYSDVVIGALIGSAVGYAVPALHARGEPYAPSRQDLAAAGAGALGGILISELIPVGDPPGAANPMTAMTATSTASPVAPPRRTHSLPLRVDQVHLAPLAVHDGAGVAISGRVRSGLWDRPRRHPGPPREAHVAAD
jgi:membrane-associated phospholipid phosphatase